MVVTREAGKHVPNAAGASPTEKRPPPLIRHALATAAVAALISIWRQLQFGEFELQSDQAFFAQWIIRLADAPHFFPARTGDQGWIAALMRDEASFLNIFLRQIYQAQTTVFLTVSTFFFTACAKAAGATMESIVGISIAAAGVGLWLLALFPMAARRNPGGGKGRREDLLLGAVALILGGACSFLNLFSVLGPHNTGILFLILAAIATQRWLNAASRAGAVFADRRLAALMFVAQCLAIYAHYTNVFLLAPATVLAILLDPSLRSAARLGLAARYSALIFCAFVPTLALMSLYSSQIGGSENDQTFAGVASYFGLASTNPGNDAVGERMVLWFRDISGLFTAPGLALGIAGTIGIAYRSRLMVPVAIVAAHFAAAAIMPSFGQYDRTAAYLMPFLCLGCAWSILTPAQAFASARRSGNRRIAAAGGGAFLLVTVALAIHATDEWKRIEDPSKVIRWGALTGKPVWRPVIARIDAEIPRNGVLLPWDYGLSHLYRTMSARSRQDVKVSRPLETFASQLKAGSLRTYLDVRGVGLNPAKPIFLLAPADERQDELVSDLRGVFGAGGFGFHGTLSLKPVIAWRLPAPFYTQRNLGLFQIVWIDSDRT